MYDPQAGVVRIADEDIRKFSLLDLRARMAVVLQDPYLFDTSILENITLGDERLSGSAIETAIDRTLAREVIARQSEGRQTKVGERGSKLSAGERQLIAFARAMARDPKILILDEATSAVDPETESLVQAGLENLIEGRTAIIIAHRLSTIRLVDRILVLSNGELIESGTHTELMRNKGMYYKLYELQFSDPE